MNNWKEIIHAIDNRITAPTIGVVHLVGIRADESDGYDKQPESYCYSGVFWYINLHSRFYSCVEQRQFREWSIQLLVGGRVYNWSKFDYENADLVVPSDLVQ